ncbi:ATP-binding cassette domain-containing protein [Streptococcaceae bacterium ESL0729]|nr:ATP-binding cassette domain-containing protein [Streptococcaceae bacterium ESL0729]
MIELCAVEKKIGSRDILKDLNLQIPKGKLVAFIGPNGAGKSTMLSLISRLQNISQGKIYIDDKEIKSWSSRDLSRRLAILKQSNSYNLKITVRDLVSFGRYPHSKGRLTTEDKEVIDQVLRKMNLWDLAQDKIDQLSGGQLQRVYIAMILAQDSDYMLFDEPLNNLDMNHAQQIMKELRGLVQNDDKTVFIVLHDINFAASYADHIIAMKGGQIFKEGKTPDIIREDILSDLYDMDIQVHQIMGKPFCLYFN